MRLCVVQYLPSGGYGLYGKSIYAIFSFDLKDMIK